MSDDVTVSDVLEHFGVRGMRWGVRRGSSSDSGGDSGSDGPKIVGPSNKVSVKQRKKTKDSVRTLSDDDLNAFIKRLDQEKKFRDLVNSDIAPGKTATKKILGDTGTRVAKTVLYTAGIVAASKLVSKYISKEVGDKLSNAGGKKK